MLNFSRHFKLPREAIIELGEMHDLLTPILYDEFRSCEESIKAALTYEFYRYFRQKRVSDSVNISILPRHLQKVIADPVSLVALSRLAIQQSNPRLPLRDLFEVDLFINPRDFGLADDSKILRSLVGILMEKPRNIIRCEINSEVIAGKRDTWEIVRPKYIKDPSADRVVFLARIAYLLGYECNLSLPQIATKLDRFKWDKPRFAKNKFYQKYAFVINPAKYDSVRKRMHRMVPWILAHMHADYAHMMNWKECVWSYRGGKYTSLARFVIDVLGSSSLMLRNEQEDFAFCDFSSRKVADLYSKTGRTARRIPNVPKNGIQQPVTMGREKCCYPYMIGILGRKNLIGVSVYKYNHLRFNYDENKLSVRR